MKTFRFGAAALVLSLASVFGASCATSPRGAAPEAGFDTIIRNGRIVDGSGNAWFYGDVGIRDGRIAAVGNLAGEQASETIDASGRVVAPGFIDVHSHADETMLEIPTADNFIRDGVTTIVVGNCGSGVEDVGAYFAAVEETGAALNVATLYGHNTILRQLKGSVKRDLTPEEMDRGRALMEEAMLDGAVGMSTGLIYSPGQWSDTSEIVEFQKVAGRHGGIYATHMRSEGQNILSAIEEALHVGRESGSRVEISHFKMPADAVQSMGGSDVSLGAVYAAREAGQEVWLDQYPYSASNTGLSALFMDWLFEDGPAEARKKLDDPEVVGRLLREMHEHHSEKRLRKDMSFAVIATSRGFPELQGYNLKEAAQIFRLRAERGADTDFEAVPRSEWPEVTMNDQFLALIEIQKAGGGSGVYHTMPEEQVRNIMRSPLVSVASDSGIRRFQSGHPHPRGYGTNARVLGRYVRDENVIGLEDAVRKMTSLPATAFRFADRGLLRPGYVADIVVFDPGTVIDNATFEAPHAYATGFDIVMVNGETVVRNDEVTGALPGGPVYGPGHRGSAGK